MKNYSGYHRYNTNAKIKNDALYILNRTIDGYAGKDVIIDGEDKRILIYERYDADGKAYKIIGYPEDIERGNLVKYKDENWLITTKPEDNDVYKKAIMQLCSYQFPITTPPTKIVTGTDSRGRPIEKIIPGITEYTPCVVKFNDASTAVADVNKAINLLDNQVMVTITFKEASSINYNERFDLYRDTYRIIKINESDSINKVGIIHITGERVTNAGDSK